MIDLNIFQFGGRGGSSGGRGGSGGKSFGGSAGGSGGGAYASPDRSTNTSYRTGRIVKDSEISKTEQYTLFKIQDENSRDEKGYKNAEGKVLREFIADDKIVLFNRKLGVWFSPKTKQYFVIRKREKNGE